MIPVIFNKIYYPNSRIDGKMVSKVTRINEDRSVWYRGWADERTWSMCPGRKVHSDYEYRVASGRRSIINEGVAT